MRAGRIRIVAGAALLLAAMAGGALAQPPLEEEQVNPSEVVFENGRPYMHADGAMQALRTRQQDGETIYYRMVRYDPQEGYVTGSGEGAVDTAGPLIRRAVADADALLRPGASLPPGFLQQPVQPRRAPALFGAGLFRQLQPLRRLQGSAGGAAVAVRPRLLTAIVRGNEGTAAPGRRFRFHSPGTIRR